MDAMAHWMKEGRCTVIGLITSLRFGESVAEFHRCTNPGLGKLRVSEDHGGTRIYPIIYKNARWIGMDKNKPQH